MHAISYMTRNGVKQFKPAATADEVSEGTMGFCLACGEEAGPVEPDARKYDCESCGQPKVYGLEELATMGLLRLDAEDSDDDGDEMGGDL